MNRREFSLRLTRLAGLGLPGAAFASAADPVEGTDYTRLETPLPEPRDGKIEVVEFFWYGCPHCFAFEPSIEPWIARLPGYVRFHRVPVQFGARYETHQQVYCTWEALGLVDAMHAKTFARFHVEHRPIDSEEDMLEFARASGLDVAKVKQAWGSFSVRTRMAQAKTLADNYGIDGVPMIGIHGRYTTAPSLNGAQNCLGTVDTLAARLHQGT